MVLILKKNTKELLFIILINLSIRLILVFPFLKTKYMFIGSYVPYFLEPDSYYVYNHLKPILNPIIIYLLPIGVFIISLVLFYKIMELEGVKDKFLYSMLFSLSYPILLNTYFGFIDTQPYILCILLVSIYFILCYSYFAIIPLILLYFFWNKLGFLLIVMIILGVLIINSKKYRVLLIIPLISIVIYIFPQFLYFLSAQKEITELAINSNWLYFLYGLFFFMFTILKINIKEPNYNKTKLFYIPCISFFILGIIFRRFDYFFILFSVLILLLIYKKLPLLLKYIIISFIYISVIISCVFLWGNPPFMNRNIEAQLSALEPIEIVGNWGFGYYYLTFAPGNTLYYASPYMIKAKLYEKGLVTLNYSYFDRLNTTPEYYLIINNKEITKPIYIIEGFNRVNNPETNNENYIIIFKRIRKMG